MKYAVLILTLILAGAWFGYYRAGLEPDAAGNLSQLPWGVLILLLGAADIIAVVVWLIRLVARV